MNTLFDLDSSTLPEKETQQLGKLEYATNWNGKLDCTSYTTLRLANSSKSKGRKFAIYLKGKRIHDAEIVDIKTISIDQINEWIARLDTGYSREKCISVIKTMYKNKPVDWSQQKLNWILFRKLDY